MKCYSLTTVISVWSVNMYRPPAWLLSHILDKMFDDAGFMQMNWSSHSFALIANKFIYQHEDSWLLLDCHFVV